VLGGVALAALAGALVGIFTLGDHGGSKTPPSASGSGPIRLSGLTAYDPDGSPPGEEHNEEAKNATDGDEGTYWPTESYNGADLNKSGVGVILDAHRNVSPKTITVATDTPGFIAEIRAGETSTSFHRVSPPQTVEARTTFRLDGGGRYFVVWITDLGGNSSAHVNEVTAK
jgi:hypothetical protein